MEVKRQEVIAHIEQMMTGHVSHEDVGWWAYDLLMEKDLNFEPGYEKILEDVLWALHYFHDPEPLMRQFYPQTEEILYFLRCLKGEEIYQRSRVVHWRV